MNRVLTIVSLMVFSIGILSMQNNSSRTFAQFAINQSFTISESATIDAHMSTIPGVVISRTDHTTKSYFCVIEAGTTITLSDFVSHFNTLGYTISCYYSGIHGVDNLVAPLSLKNCTDD